MPYFEDRDFGLIYIAIPPEGVAVETVLSHAVSQQLGSPVPLPLDAILTCSPDALDTWEKAFFLHAQVSGKPFPYPENPQQHEHLDFGYIHALQPERKALKAGHMVCRWI